MTIKEFVFNPFMENTYLLIDDEKNTIVIDPGCYEQYEKEEISEFIVQEQLQIKLIFNTHCHIDHVLGNAFFKEKYGVELWIPKGEKQVLDSVSSYAPMWGITNYQDAKPDVLFEGDQLKVGKMNFEVLLCPGHSPGHLVLFDSSAGKIIGGDVLFRESIGRTDLPGGNHDQLLRNIKEQLFTLPDDVEVFPGHGGRTTIGHEKVYNPFLR